MLTRRARRRRGLAAAAFVGVLVAGNTWGEDDHFPFAPMRMYAHRTSGSVKELKLVGVTMAGNDIRVRFHEVRLRRAEAAGQAPRFEADPSLMRHLARAYHRARPDAAALRELKLMYLVYPLGRDGRPSGRHKDVVAVWRQG